MQTAQPTDRPHRNQGLFSDHYLNATLPTRPDWRALADEARPAMEEIASLLDSYTPSENEAQVEEELVRPVLRLLGHTFEVQPALATPEGTKRPDYVLYRDAGSVAANKDRRLTDESLKGRAFAVADAKYWERPLAVYLAKLSLWLATVAKDRPLSFLDHHLKTGDSLVGARIAEVGPGGGKKRKKAKDEDEAQLSMMEDDAFLRSVSNAVGSIWLIEESPADTLEEVREQERLYARLREDLTRRYARLADLATATHFGVAVDRPLWKPLTDYATGRAPYAPPQFARWLEESETLATERRYFHWELEFPEVFFDRQGRPLGDAAGFDAVVGNPPYVQSKRFPQLKPYLQEIYSETYKGKADLYVYFFQLGLSKLRYKGRMGYISSGLFSKLDYGAPLRQFLTSRSTLLEIVEFSEEQVFEGALTYPIILTLKNEPPKENATVGLRSAANLVDSALPEQNSLPTADDIWAFTDESLQHVIRGWAQSTPLGDVLGARYTAELRPISTMLSFWIREHAIS